MMDLQIIPLLVKNNTFEGFLSHAKGKRVICFGTGYEARRAMNDELRDIRIEYFIDNNEERQGTEFLGASVCAPSVIESENIDDIVVVLCAAFKNILEMYKQVSRMGVKHIFASCLFDGEARQALGRRFTGEYIFDDRRKGSENLLVVLSGYKEPLWDIVFKRIAAFVPNDFDVCIVCSGRDAAKMRELAERQSWSYLSTKENKLSLAQNIAIEIHPKACKIFKLDEDMFIPEGYFTEMLRAYKLIEEAQLLRIGVLSPLIPVNVSGYIPFIEKLGLWPQMETRFKAELMGNGAWMLHENTEFVRFLWEKSLPFDSVAAKFSNNKTAPITSAYRFSIGAILFKRDLWEEMYGFDVGNEGDVGNDEIHLCSYCSEQFLAIYIDTNILAGHLSYGKQNAAMTEFFKENKHRFDIEGTANEIL